MEANQLLNALEEGTLNELGSLEERFEQAAEMAGNEGKVSEEYKRGFLEGAQVAKISILRKIKMTRNIIEIKKEFDRIE